MSKGTITTGLTWSRAATIEAGRAGNRARVRRGVVWAD